MCFYSFRLLTGRKWRQVKWRGSEERKNLSYDRFVTIAFKFVSGLKGKWDGGFNVLKDFNTRTHTHAHALTYTLAQYKHDCALTNTHLLSLSHSSLARTHSYSQMFLFNYCQEDFQGQLLMMTIDASSISEEQRLATKVIWAFLKKSRLWVESKTNKSTVRQQFVSGRRGQEITKIKQTRLKLWGGGAHRAVDRILPTQQPLVRIPVLPKKFHRKFWSSRG